MSSFPPPNERYGLLLSGALLAALPTDVDRQKIMDYTYETFLGWRRMCELSKDWDSRMPLVVWGTVIGGVVDVDF